MGRAAAGARVWGCTKLLGDGSARWVTDGAAGRDCGFVGCVEGSGGDEAWGVFGVDR